MEVLHGLARVDARHLTFPTVASRMLRSPLQGARTTAEVSRTGLLVLRHGGRPGPDGIPGPLLGLGGPVCLATTRPSWQAGGMEPGVWSPRVVFSAVTVLLRRPPCLPGGPFAWTAWARFPRGTCLVRINYSTSTCPVSPPVSASLRPRNSHTTRQPSLLAEKKRGPQTQKDDDEAQMAWHVPALSFGGWMGNSVLDATTGSEGRWAGAEPAASDAPGEGEQSQEDQMKQTSPSLHG